MRDVGRQVLTVKLLEWITNSAALHRNTIGIITVITITTTAAGAATAGVVIIGVVVVGATGCECVRVLLHAEVQTVTRQRQQHTHIT